MQAELAAWAEKLPESAVFTGMTAARLRGLWLPPLPADLPVFVAVPIDASRSKRAGVRVTRHRSMPAYETVGGLRVATVPELLLACARHLGLLDLVVLVDSSLHLELCPLDELRVAAASRRPGAHRLREVLSWCDGRSQSPWETLLRLLHVVCGVPVEPQAVVRAADGSFVARADLRIVGTCTLQEYDGLDHLQQRQYRRDRRRDSRVAGAGYHRHGYVSEDVIAKPLGILREADRALGRPHDPARIHAWYALLRESLFTAAGMEVVRRRWGLRASGDAAA